MIRGSVIHGEGLGKILGYPTANLNLRKSQVSLSSGIYAAEAVFRGKTYYAAIVIHEKPWKVEVYLINYKGKDFYGEMMRVNPIQKVGQLERYDSIAELKEKIAADVKIVNDFFADRKKKKISDMFTGIVQTTGTITEVKKKSDGFFISVIPKKNIGHVRRGDSISVNGVCLTVIKSAKKKMTFEIMPETMRKTTLVDAIAGDTVNIEPSLRIGDGLGGHMLYGHVDGVGTISKVFLDGETLIVQVRIPANLVRYTILLGSISFDGISLTIARRAKNIISVSLTKETLNRTIWRNIAKRKKVNVETDCIAKYVEAMICLCHSPDVKSGESHLN